MQTFKARHDIPAASVFLGTLPLFGAIVGPCCKTTDNIKTMDRRLVRIENRTDSIDGKLSAVLSA